MKRTKIVCPCCGQEISRSNFTKHQRRHEIHPETFKLVLHVNKKTQNCIFCGKHYEKIKSLANHQRFCKLNPNREEATLLKLCGKSHTKGKPNWAKGLTKDTDSRIQKGVESRKHYYQTHPGSFKGKHHSAETKKILSEKAKEHNLGGRFYRNEVEINGVKFDSSYEIMLAEDLNKNRIVWERGKKFKYKDLQDNIHTYTPDFYLPDYNIYLDPKNDYLINNINPALGYKDSDKIKWVCEQNNIVVIILNKDELLWDVIQKKIKELPRSFNG